MSYFPQCTMGIQMPQDLQRSTSAHVNGPSSHIPSYHGSTQGHPRLCYYIFRSNNTFVPLIPADELPFNVKLKGVPRILNSDQTFGMQPVGELQYTGITFKLDNESNMQRSNSQPPTASHGRSLSGSSSNNFSPDTFARQALTNSSVVSHMPFQQSLPQRSVPAHEAASNWRSNPTSDPQAVIDAIVGTSSGAAAAERIGYVSKSNTPLPPSGAKPDQEKKEYCTHWIRHGECDYMQQGCLFKHEMPDKATLEKIGFRGIPRWWQEKNQAVRVGGEKASVGPIVKPSVWLKSKHDEDSEEGEDSDHEAKKVEHPPPSARLNDGEKGAKQTTREHSAEVAEVNERISVVASTDERKKSVTGDLINFEPLTPTPIGVVVDPTPESKSVGPGRRRRRYDDSDYPAVPIYQSKQIFGSKQRQGVAPSSPSKVFVPSGESPAKHIVEAKKRGSGSPPKCSSTASAAPVEKQIQSLQKSKHNGGLMASKHAVPMENSSATEEQITPASKRTNKLGCRVRWPASASPPASTSKDAPKP